MEDGYLVTWIPHLEEMPPVAGSVWCFCTGAAGDNRLVLNRKANQAFILITENHNQDLHCY